MKRAAIYVRVSTPDQHVESQLRTPGEFAATERLRGRENTRSWSLRAEHVVRNLTHSWRMPGEKSSRLSLVAAFDRIGEEHRTFSTDNR